MNIIEFAIWTSTRTRSISNYSICFAECYMKSKNDIRNGYKCESKFSRSNKFCFEI